MASMLSMQIKCAVCLNPLRDPVCLPCQHSYCRVCITCQLAVNGDESTCPECRSPFSREDITVSRALRNIVDAARTHLLEHEALKERVIYLQGGQDQTYEQCPDHYQMLTLFCEMDQKPVCVICREEERHQGHRFKTLRDAHQAKKARTAEMLDALCTENETLVNLIESQADEIIKTRVKSKALSDQISEQFEEMHRFLREKEEEVKALLDEEEDKLLEGMEIKLFTMEERLSEGRVNQGILMSAVEMDKPCQFLQWWAETGQLLTGCTAPFREVQSLEEVTVIPNSLFFGPYETHLKFFVWKEMLTCIQPVPHHHAVEVQGGGQSVKVSPSSLSVWCRKESFKKNKHGTPWLKTESSFGTGQHYWEVDVGQKLEWETGVCSCGSEQVSKDTVLCFSTDTGYHIQQPDRSDRMPMLVTPRPRKIGVYLDCERRQVWFYNADSMTLIITVKLQGITPHSLCISPGQYLNGKNGDPLTVCWY